MFILFRNCIINAVAAFARELRIGLLSLLFRLLFAFFIVVEEIRDEGQQHDHDRDGDGVICAGRVLDEARQVAQVRYSKHRSADNVFIMDQAAVGNGVGVAFGGEPHDGLVLLVGDHFEDAVGRDGVFIEHKGNDVPFLKGKGVDFFYVYEGAYVICGFHGSREDRVNAQSRYADADQKDGHQDDRDHKKCSY